MDLEWMREIAARHAEVHLPEELRGAPFTFGNWIVTTDGWSAFAVKRPGDVHIDDAHLELAPERLMIEISRHFSTKADGALAFEKFVEWTQQLSAEKCGPCSGAKLVSLTGTDDETLFCTEECPEKEPHPCHACHGTGGLWPRIAGIRVHGAQGPKRWVNLSLLYPALEHVTSKRVEIVFAKPSKAGQGAGPVVFRGDGWLFSVAPYGAGPEEKWQTVGLRLHDEDPE